MPTSETHTSEAFAALVDAMNEGALILSPDGTILHCNPCIASTVGVRAMELPGIRIQDLVTPDCRGKMLGLLEQAIQRRCGGEVVLAGAHGTSIPCQIALGTARYNNTDAVCAVITDLRGADAARESLLSLAAIVEASMDAIVSETPDGTVLSWNRGAELLYGYASDEMIGASISRIVPPGKLDELGWLFGRVQRGESTLSFETVRQRKDGSLIDISLAVSPLRDYFGRVTGACTIARDITVSKRARDRLQSVLESAPDSMVVFHESGEIVFVNTATERTFGFRRHELIGRNVDTLLAERVRSRRQSLTGGVAWPSRHLSMREKRRLTLHRSNGAEFPAEVSLGLVEGGQAKLICGLIRDITERRLLQETLREKNLQLEDAIQAKDRFLAAMSHELRTPLNGILGLTGLLLMKLSGPLTAEQERQLEILRLSAKHLLSIINDLLDLAKLTSSKADLLLEPVHCDGVLEEVCAALQPLAAEKCLALTVQYAGPSVMLRTNRRYLRQILFNLASNAVKYTEAGSVSLSLRRASQDGEAVVQFVVEDTGIGISPEDKPRLFQEFARLNTDRSAPNDSTGLGLHLSQKMAELLDGEITVESEPGKGSAFTLTLRAPSV